MTSYAERQTIKVILLGDSGVGKTSIARFISDDMPAGTSLRRGSTEPGQMRESYYAFVPCNGATVKFQLWDTCGQEKYHTLTASFLRCTDVVLLVYDISNEVTFRHTHSSWKTNGIERMPWLKQVERQQSQSDTKCFLYLVGNKLDLQDTREVETHSARQLADEIDAEFAETSAKDGTGISELFAEIAKKFPESHSSEHLQSVQFEGNTATLSVDDRPQAKDKQKGRCC